MALQKQTVTMRLGVTQDEGTHPFVLPNPLLQSLINGRAVKGGAIKKRPGWDRQIVVNADSQIVQVNDTLLAIEPSVTSGQPARKLSVAQRLGTTTPRADSVSGTALTRSLSEIEVLGRENVWRDMSYDGQAVNPYSSFPDHNYDSVTGIEVIAWTGRRNALFCIFAVAIDATTRQPVSTVRIVSSPTTGDCQKPRVLTLSGQNSIVVVYERPASNELRAVAFDTSARTWGTDTVMKSDLHADATPLTLGTGPYWDAYASGGVWFCAYRSATPNLTLFKATGVTVSSTTTIAEDPICIGIYADVSQTHIWFGYYLVGTGLRVAVRNSTTLATVVLSPTTVEGVTDFATQITFAPITTNQVVIVWTTMVGAVNIAANNNARCQTKYCTVTTAGALGTQCSRGSFELISRAWKATNGGIYANVLYDAANLEDGLVPGSVEGRRSAGFQTAFTMCLVHSGAAAGGAVNSSFRPCASWAIGSAGMTRRYSSLSNAVSVTSAAVSGATSYNATEYRFVLATEAVQEVQDGKAIVGASGADLCRLNISSSNVVTQFAAPIGRNVAFSGGIPMVFDGETLTEYGFLVPPENGRGVVAAGGALSAGAYAVTLVSEYMLATGDAIRSAPSPVYDSVTNTSPMTAALNNKITVGVPALSLTNKYSDVIGADDSLGVTIKAYRTEMDGTLYRYEGAVANAYGAVINKPLQAGTNLSILVQNSDAELLAHTFLYTSGDILPNYPLPAVSHLINHANRLMGISAEDRRVLVFTHTYEPGELPGWHPDLQIQLDDEAVALASLDDRLVILCKHGVYIISGTGPDRKGLNSDFNGPDRVNGPHGCVSATSVVSIPLGIIWQAPTGMVMLDRKFGVSRIGGPVEDTVAAYPVCFDAKAWPKNEWVYWSMWNGESDTETVGYRTVVFDWRNNVWSVDIASYVPELPPNVVTGPRSFAVYREELYSTFATISALYQHTGYDDLGYSLGSIPGAWIELYMKTAWINLGQVLGFQRARWLSILAEPHSSHGLVLVLTQDQGLSSETFQWPNADITALTREKLKHHIKNQRCSSVQLEIADAQGDAVSPFGAGASFVGVSWELAFKAGTPKLPNAALR